MLKKILLVTFYVTAMTIIKLFGVILIASAALINVYRPEYGWWAVVVVITASVINIVVGVTIGWKRNLKSFVEIQSYPKLCVTFIIISLLFYVGFLTYLQPSLIVPILGVVAVRVVIYSKLWMEAREVRYG